MPHPPLSIVGVYASLVKISKTKGAGTAKQRQSIVEQLLLSAKGEEVRYIMRTLSQNLRVGAVRTTILTALARATALTRPTSHANLSTSPSPYFVSEDILEAVQPLPDKKGKKKGDIVDEARSAAMTKMAAADSLIKMVFVKHPCFDDIVETYLSSGLESLAEEVPLTVGGCHSFCLDFMKSDIMFKGLRCFPLWAHRLVPWMKFMRDLGLYHLLLNSSMMDSEHRSMHFFLRHHHLSAHRLVLTLPTRYLAAILRI